MDMAWYHPLHPSTLRESCLLPPFTRRNALFELDSRIATAWHHPLHPSTLRESCLLPPFIRRNAPFELDSRIAGWHGLVSPSPSLYLKRVMLTPAVYPAQCSV